MNKEFKSIVDISNINDSMELDSGQEIAYLKKGPYMVTLEVCGEVKVRYKNRTYKTASRMPEELIQQFHNGTAYENEDFVDIIFNNWLETFIWEKEGDEYECTGISDVSYYEGCTAEDIESGLEDYLDKYIEDYWLDHAHNVLNKNFPKVDEGIKDEFACEYWQNGRSDEENINDFKKFKKYMEGRL